MHEPSIGTSAKVVVWHEDSVLLGLNDRGEWELPGGRPEASDRRLVATVCRELWEEAGIEVGPAHLQLVDAELFETVPDAWVSLVFIPHGSTERPALPTARNTPQCGSMK